jgi:hypothetical protein
MPGFKGQGKTPLAGRLAATISASFGVLASSESLRRLIKTNWPNPLGLEARSSVADFSHLPLVNSLVRASAGTPTPVRLCSVCST